MLASRSRSLVQAVSFWPRIGKAQFRIRASLCEVNGEQRSTETGFSLSTTGFRSVTIIPFSSTCCSYRRTAGRSLGTFQKAMMLRKLEGIA
jgi:hypothetical protein